MGTLVFFGFLGPILPSFRAFEGYFGPVLGSFWGLFWGLAGPGSLGGGQIRAILGLFWACLYRKNGDFGLF